MTPTRSPFKKLIHKINTCALIKELNQRAREVKEKKVRSVAGTRAFMGFGGSS